MARAVGDVIDSQILEPYKIACRSCKNVNQECKLSESGVRDMLRMLGDWTFSASPPEASCRGEAAIAMTYLQKGCQFHACCCYCQKHRVGQLNVEDS